MTSSKPATNDLSQQGFTILELLTTLAILSIFFAMTLPSLKRLFQHHELDSSARQFVSEVRSNQMASWSHGDVQEIWLYRFKPQYQLSINGQGAGIVKLPDNINYLNGYLEPSVSTLRFDPTGTLTGGGGQVRLVNKQREGADINVMLMSGTVVYEGVHP
ncbi:prepilin-type N-terminal cleavage/methylation domain-containing protein [Tumebacillus sp. ITR2]|uniref:Prepilin-type N-terminal cleavage/methylation domain-containing protein n=1 Tax=Tumebacillus amylolyticus TaxID=2801339 RepID=A0ABS1J9S7_9BACL|nr:prepilin-type N-terminal cleavage/methylation domain-containing protein [Tumebacillus amylolyticus]MBL0387033.1 prepilin-type N-terminal cleavage/methylation domain-containing protein [Tumebacillus amylolyticus]